MRDRIQSLVPMGIIHRMGLALLEHEGTGNRTCAKRPRRTKLEDIVQRFGELEGWAQIQHQSGLHAANRDHKRAGGKRRKYGWERISQGVFRFESAHHAIYCTVTTYMTPYLISLLCPGKCNYKSFRRGVSCCKQNRAAQISRHWGGGRI